MTTKSLTLLIAVLGLLGACAKEQPPRSVTEFLENPMMLEAAVVRCSQNRAESRYDAECVNAREAVKRIEGREEAIRREEAEKRSEKKRRALRRTQQAAAEARRRAAEAERERREAEYLAQFGELPPESRPYSGDAGSGNAPGMEVSESAPVPVPVPADSEPYGEDVVFTADPAGDTMPATDSGNAQTVEIEPEAPPTGDLDAIRDELRRRNEDSGN
jgi:hypothetical protein